MDQEKKQQKVKTQAAQCAQVIRKILKGQFPEIKFKVKSENYAGGDSVNVSYIDGVPVREVEKWIKGFQYGHFDGMTDCYEYSNNVDGRPQTKYLFVNRHISEIRKEEIKNEIMEKYQMTEFNDDKCHELFNCWSAQIIYKNASERTFIN
jgi:hypothetical protein